MRKTFDIKDMMILTHLDKQVNQTQYIISLIKKDMNCSQEVNKDMVIRIIEEYLGNHNTIRKTDMQVESSVQNILSMIR